MTKNITVLYHGNCYDGFGAAWAAWQRLKTTAQYIPVSYGHRPPAELSGVSTLYIVDFSYPRETLLELAQQIFHITVLDHHKTAQADLAGLGRPAHRFDVELTPAGLYTQFDMNESGASLAWEYFNPPEPPVVKYVPPLIQYVKDRDLWLFQQPKSREIHAWLRSYPFDFEKWDWLNWSLSEDASFYAVVAEGEAILRSTDQQVEAMCKHVTWADIAGYRVPLVNTTAYFSEVGDYLCQAYPDVPFAAYYLDRADGKRQWGLRSHGEFDVSEIAKRYGGGGHKNAAGFVTDRPSLGV